MERNWSAKVTANWNKWLRKQCPCSFRVVKTIHTECGCCHNAVCKLTIASISSVKYRLIVTLPARETVYIDVIKQMPLLLLLSPRFWLPSPSCSRPLSPSLSLPHSLSLYHITYLTTAKEKGSPCCGRMKEYCGDGGGFDGDCGTGRRLCDEIKIN